MAGQGNLPLVPTSHRVAVVCACISACVRFGGKGVEGRRRSGLRPGEME